MHRPFSGGEYPGYLHIFASFLFFPFTITMNSPAVTAQSLTPVAVQAAYDLVQPYVHRTPLLTCKTLDSIASTPQSPEALIGTPFEGQTPARPKFRFYFKCENLQRIGAFKARGAFHALLRLLEARGEEEVKRHGVITHSSGIYPYSFLAEPAPMLILSLAGR